MGKMYDFTLTVGADDSAVNQVLSLLEKNLIKATKKENVITFVADANNVDKTLKEITELHPTVGASVELVIDQSQINKELDFLNSVLSSNIDADQIVKKFKSSFTSEIKGLKLGEILNAEVGSNTRSIKNVQSAVNQLVDRLSKVDISKSMDISEMTAYIKDLETAKLLVSEISKSTKLKNVNTKLLEPIVDTNSLKDAYSKIGDIIYNNQEMLLTNLQEKSISLITDVQDRLNNILKNGAGFELVPSAELEKAEKELAEMESILELTDKTAKQLEKDMAATVNKIEEFADKDNQNKVSENQKKLIQLATAYAETGVNLFDESAIDKVPEKLEDIAYAVQEARQNLKGYKFELVSEEDVEEQKARVDRIKSEMVEASKSTKESAAKIETEPAVEPTKFSKKVTEQAVTPASIPVEGVIENPEEFAQNVSRQLTVPAQIEVEGVVSSTEEFAKEVSNKVGTIPLDVTIGEATSVSDITKETAEATKAAKEEIEGEGFAAKTAAEYKKEFAEANIQVAASAAKTEKAAKKAAKAIEEEGLSSAKREKTVQRELSNSARISRLKGRKSDDNFSFESILNEAQTSSAYFRYNEETNDYDVSSSLISNYEKLGKAIAESDANLVKLNYQLQNHIDRGTDTAAIINKINAEQEVNNRLVETWIKLENDEDQVVGADENKWLNTLRDETQLKEINNQRDREAIEISKAHSAALEENARRDQQAAKQREQALQAEQKFRRAIDEEAEKGNKQANTEREKALQEEQKIRRSLAESQAKANEKALAEREKTLQAEQKIRQSIADSQEKANEKALAEREKNLQAEQKIRYAIAKAEKQASDKADAEAKKASKAQSIADTKVEKELQAELSSIYKRQEDIVKERYKLTAQLLSLDKDDIEDKEKIAVIQEKQNALTKEYLDLQVQKNALPDDVEKQEHLLKVIEDETTAYNQLARVQNKASKKKDASEQNGRAAAAYKELTKQAKAYYTLLNKETARTLTKTEEDELSKLKSEWEDAAKGVGKYNTSIEGTAKSLKDATQAKDKFFATGGSAVVAEMNKRFQGYQSKLEGVTETPFYYKGELLTEETQSLKEIAAIISKLNSEPIDISTKESREKIFTLETQVKDFFDEIEKGAKEVSTTSIQNNISDYLEKNTKLSLKARIELQKYAEELKNGVTADRLKEIIANFQSIQVEEREAGREGRNAFDTISQRLNDMDSKFLAQLLSWQDIIRYIREVASAVVGLDTALTEMRKVSDESLSSLQRYQDISFGIADEIGVTGQQLQESTADFMRLGESLEDAAESARVANVLRNVSEFESIDEATDSLIAMAAAYSDLEKMDIVDKLNTIGNNYAISTDGIATALQDSASALVTAYNDIDEAVALITAGNAVTQDPSKVGAGLRTIALRLTGTKEAADALNELGEETDTMITTQSKLRETIMNATKAASADGKGFDILDNNGNYKSTYEIMLGLAELYDEIVKKDKELGTNNLNLLLETIAGKNRSNIAASILQNPDLLKNAFEDSAINSANSALEENEKYLESIQGHIEQFKNAVQELFHYLLESGTINKVIDIATDFVNFLTEIVKTLGSTGSLFAAGGLILLLRNAGKIITSFSKNLPEISSAFKLLTEGTGSFKTVLKALFPNLAKFASIIIGLPTPIKLVAGALTLLGVVGYKVWDEMTITVEEAQEAIDNYESKYSELKNSFESHKKLVDEVADKYVELAAGVDTLTNKNLTLSDDDYQEYLNITKELAETYPELISRSDAYGGYVLTIGDNYKYAADQLRDYLSEEEKRYYYEKYQDLNDYTEKNKVILDDYKDQVDLAQYDVELANDKLKAVAKLKELVEEYEGASETINLTKIFDEAGISYTARNAAFQAFQAYGLDDLLKQDANEEWLLDLTDVNEANKEAIEEYFRNIVVEYGGDLTVANQELAQKTDDYNAEWKSFQQNFSDALQFMLSGDSISDETRQLARDYVGLFTSDIVEEYANAVNALDDKGNIDYKKLVNRIASQLESLTPELQEKFSKLFSLEISPEEKVEIYEELQTLFDEQGIKIPLDFVIADEKDVTERLRNKISQFVQADPHSSIPAVRDFRQAQIEEAFSSLFNELGIDTVEEYNKILSIIAECEDWEEALQKVRDEFGQINETTDAFSFNSLTDAVSDVNKKLLPQFRELGTLYDEIFNGDNGFELSGIGADDLDGIEKAFNNLDVALNISPPTEEVEKFLSVIGNADSTEEQVQNAFDGIATAYFNAAVEAGNFSKENAAVLEQMLKEMGIVNADEVVDYYTTLAEAQQLVADNGWNLVEADKAMIDGWVETVGASEETANALYILALKQIFLNENWVNEENSIAQVLALADAAGVATEAVGKLGDAQANISSLLADLKATSDPLKQAEIANDIKEAREDAKTYADEIQDEVNNFSIDFSHVGSSSGGSGSAGSAGKEAADDFEDAFEKELKSLELKRDIGLLTEKEFLEAYKALIEKFYGTSVNMPISEEELREAQEYADSLADIYKTYNGINNMERDVLIWDDANLEKYSDFVAEQYGSLEDGIKELKDTWSTVMGGVEDEGEIKIAFSQLLQTDHGLVPLTEDVLWDYIDDIYTRAIDENGVFDVEKFIQLDREGADREIYGQVEHIANMIAAAEGQYLNGIQITADDVLAIGTPGSELPDALESIFKGFSMHDIQAKTLLRSYSDSLSKMEGRTEEFVERMKDYYDRLTTYYDNVISSIVTILNHRINALQDAKTSAVDAITAEKEAAAESYQTQIDYLDELIDAKEEEIDLIDKEIEKYQDQIDAIDKQIDALEEANQKRQQAINLQKAQYDLERAQQQRSKLVYKNGQMVYETDNAAIRDARENLEDAEFEIQKQKLEDLKKPLEEQIELLEKRKKLIQDEIDGYQKQQEALQKALDASNKYYDKLIKDTEKYWDELIDKLEKTKSKFEEIAQLKELAEAYDFVMDFTKNTAYSWEDLVNGVPEAMEAFIEDYKNALLAANEYNDNFTSALALAEQDVKTALGNIADSASELDKSLEPAAQALTPIGEEATNIESTATALEKVADNSEKVSTNTGTAATNSGELATSLGSVAEVSPNAAKGIGDAAESIEKEGNAAGNANTNLEKFASIDERIANESATKAENVKKAAEAIKDEGDNAANAYTSLNNIANLNLATIVTQTNLLADAIGDVATALGLTEGNPISALQTAISNLAAISLGDESSGIIGSFNQLKTAVTGVTSAIGSGGGGSEGGDTGGEGKAVKNPGGLGGDSGESGGLIGAIGELHQAADTHIGKSAEGGGEEEGGTVISDFNALKDAVMLVAEAVGIPGENGEVAEESLLGVIQTMPAECEEPITTVTGFFEALEAAINACSTAVGNLKDAIKELGGSGGGSLGTFSFSPGAATGNVHIAEATGNVHAGNAYSSGKLGLKKNETALVGEVGQELVYNPKSGTYRTVGDNGPEITRLQKGDLIFNAEQTKAIIKNGKRDHGRSYADGNAIMPLTSEEMELFKKIGGAVTDIQADVSQMLDPVKAMAQKVTTHNTTNIAPVINITDTSFNVSGVTGDDVTRQIADVFEGMISNAYQRAMKQ